MPSFINDHTPEGFNVAKGIETAFRRIDDLHQKVDDHNDSHRGTIEELKGRIEALEAKLQQKPSEPPATA